MAELLDQLARNGGAIEQDGDVLKLREGGLTLRSYASSSSSRSTSSTAPESTEKIARQFVLTDLTMEYEFEILELDIGKINTLGKIAAPYFPEDYLLRVYFALIGRSILAGEILKALGGDKRVPEEDLINGFIRVAPISIPTEKGGTLVINYSREAIEETLRFLKRMGYVEVKAGKVKKLRDLV